MLDQGVFGHLRYPDRVDPATGLIAWALPRISPLPKKSDACPKSPRGALSLSIS